MMEPLKSVSLLALPLLLAACGDDLESRNAAVGSTASISGSDLATAGSTQTGSSQARPAATNSGADDTATQPAFGSEGDGEEEPPVVHAEPRDLIISTEGFAPEPMDNATGFAPRPTAPEPFNPNPVPEQPAQVQRAQ